MRFTILFTALGLLVIPLKVFAKSPKPFETTVVMSGMGLNWPILMGTDDTLRESGVHPDLVVGICGGSFAAAFSGLPGIDWRRESFDISNQLQFKHDSAWPLLPFFFGHLTDTSAEERLPNFGKHAIMTNVMAALENSKLNIPFSKLSRPTIIVATKLLFNPYDLPREQVTRRRARSKDRTREKNFLKLPIKLDKRALYEVVFFTDPKTAKSIPTNLVPFAKKLFPSIPFLPKIKIRTDFSVAEAVRASISDPILFHPAEIRGEYFVTGATENQPLKIFAALSERTYDSKRGPLPKHQDDIYRSIFGFSSNELGKKQQVYSGQTLLPLDYKALLPPSDLFTPSLTKTLGWQDSIPKLYFDFEERLKILEAFGRSQTSSKLKPL